MAYGKSAIVGTLSLDRAGYSLPLLKPEATELHEVSEHRTLGACAVGTPGGWQRREHCGLLRQRSQNCNLFCASVTYWLY